MVLERRFHRHFDGESVTMTIPNMLSIVRIILIPVFCVTFFSVDSGGISWWPVTILVVSGATDWLDGYIARKYNQISKLGKLLDPAADKLTQFAVCACLTVRYPQFIILLALIFVKELLMLLGGLLYMRKGKDNVPAARWYGKLATFVIYVAMGVLVVVPVLAAWIVNTLLIIILATLLFSFIMYIRLFFRLQTKTKKGES